MNFEKMPHFDNRDALVELTMNKAPRGVYDETTLQHTFRFTEVDECFHQFRLVCKSWKHAVESMTFNRKPYPYFFDQLTSETYLIPISYIQNYLQVFRKMSFNLELLDRMDTEQLNAISNCVRKLNYVSFWYHNDKDGNVPKYEIDESFITKILENSNTTLQHINIHTLIPLVDIAFPKLRRLDLHIWWPGHYLSLEEFTLYFPKVLQKHSENLEVVYCDVGGHSPHSTPPVVKYIAENYGEHCITGAIYPDLDNIPFKILIIRWDSMGLWNLMNKKYAPSVQYLHISVPHPRSLIWNRYQDIFDQFTNLKAIELSHGDKILPDVLPSFPPETQEMWKKRIAYFQKRGIHLAARNEIFKNENLQIQVAKEAGISWRLDFEAIFYRFFD